MARASQARAAYEATAARSRCSVLRCSVLRPSSRHQPPERREPARQRHQSVQQPYFDAHQRLSQDVATARKRVKEFEDLLAQRASLDAPGIDTRDVPLPRFIPVRIWLASDDDEHAARVRQAVEYLNQAIGFESTYGFASERGSFFRWWARSRDAITSEQVVERPQKAERAVELAALGRVQADVDQKQAAAAAQLIESLKSVPNGACAIGSVLVLKITDANGPRVMARTLTQKQMIAIERDDHLLRDSDPQTLLKRLSAIEDSDDGHASLTAGSPDRV